MSNFPKSIDILVQLSNLELSMMLLNACEKLELPQQDYLPEDLPELQLIELGYSAGNLANLSDSLIGRIDEVLHSIEKYLANAPQIFWKHAQQAEHYAEINQCSYCSNDDLEVCPFHG